ncbi:hypothetical protein RUM43_008923 [Polyplax serrata]|uniref:PRELI/MSF1 domain-containing protein n=1 Tax=Polyplax serrata TaxID=468196 RepID=A0AAN8S0U4_POLSC
MKIWTSEYTFSHPWETVAQAAWRKYPNPMNTAVVGTDVVERKVVNGVLHTHRLVSSQWYFPSWAQKFVGSMNVLYASELSQVDPKNKEMILKTRNLSLCNYIAVDETVKYVPDPSDPQRKTLLRQEAVVTVQGVPLGNRVENLMTNTISVNARKGRQAIEWVISKIEAEVQELKNLELINQTKKSIDDFTSSAKKSMDELSTAAKKSFDSFAGPPNQKLPKF